MPDLSIAHMRTFGPHRPARTVFDLFRELWSYREVIFNIAATQIQTQYRGSSLGLLWTVLAPMTLFAVYAVVFGYLIGRNIENYALFLISGMAPFLAFQQCAAGGCRSFITGESYLRRVYLPKLLFPTVTLAVQLFGFLCTLTAVLLLAPFLHASVSVHWLLLPVSVLVLFLFNYGIVMVLAVVNVHLPDFEHIITAGMRALYFLTPIIYVSGPPLPKAVILINIINPMTHFLVLFRAPLYYNSWPTPQEWLTAILLALGSFVVGATVLRFTQRKLIYAM